MLMNSLGKKILCYSVLLIVISCFTFAQSVFLPFKDDFSSYTGKPDSTLFVNHGCNVNSGYQYLPPTIGVVTLDILNSKGEIYPQANVYSFSADTLESVSIRMDSIMEPTAKRLALSDSVYFSFFVQPGGSMGNMWERIGIAPSSKDSIVLQFYKSNQNVWQSVWQMNGTSLDSIYAKDSVYFLQNMIAVNDTAYFNKDFRFRFINFGSLDSNPSYDYVSNRSQWNIDYIYMNINRSQADTTIRDIAFVNPAPSLLKYFTAIPSKHFTAEYMKDSLDIRIANLYSSTLNSNYSFSISDSQGNNLYTYQGGYENIVSYPKTHSFQTAPNHSRPAVNYVFSPEENSKYIITHIVVEGVGQDYTRENDTTRFTQVFSNYFAYDDGTSESGIGVEANSSSAFAVKYPLLTQDTLYAVDIYFNQSWQNANLKPFYLSIYNATDDSISLPNEEIYSSARLTPAFDSLDKFTRYNLDYPLILPSGDFFICLQSASRTYLNIGFDQNNDASNFMFEKKQNEWSNVFLKGAPMIRPLFGAITVGITDIVNNESAINIYPNPASDFVIIENKNYNNNISYIEIYSINGKLLKRIQSNYNSTTIDIRNLNNGIYILKIGNIRKKLIIAR